jgi:hypothetical protein
MMPLNDRRRLDQDQGIQAGWPEAVQPNPKSPIAGTQAGSTGVTAPQDRHLKSEGDDLQFQRDAAAKTTGQQGKGGGSDREHAGDDIGTEPITPWFVSVIDFAIGTSTQREPIDARQTSKGHCAHSIRGRPDGA